MTLRPASDSASPAPAPTPLRKPSPESTDFALKIAASLLAKQAEDLAILDVSGPMAIVDYFVIATVASTRQAQAMAKDLDQEVKQLRGRRKRNQGGMETEDSNWVLLDFDEVVVHLLLPEARTYYGLESLYADAPRLEAPEAAAPAAQQDEAPQRRARRKLRLSQPPDEDS